MAYYKICLQGHIDARRAAWFEGLAIDRLPNGETVLSGSPVDQAALFGILSRIRDLGLPLLSLTQVALDNSQAADFRYPD